MPAHKPRFRLSPTLLAMLASGILLSGCDLWGGSDTQANASPASEDAPVVVAQMEEASSANGSYLFGKTNLTGVVHDVDENGNPIDRVTLVGQRLHFVDPATGLELTAAAIDVDADSTQLVSQAFTLSSDGWRQIAGHNVQLFFTDGHKLYKVDLLAPTVPSKTQVSAEDHICQLLKVIPKDANAASSWILLTATTNADGDCSSQGELVTKMVSSDTPDTDPAASTDSISQVLTIQRDDLGNLQGLFGLAPAKVITNTNDTSLSTITRDLIVMDGATGATGEVPLDALDAGLSATYFDRVAGSKAIYLRVTNGSNVNGLYVLDWHTGTASLSRAAVATLAAADSVFMHADTSANYFVDGLSLIALPAGGTSTVLATLGKGVPQAGGVMTSSYLVVPQLDGDGNLGLQAFSKTKANSARDIVLPQAGGLMSIVAHNGDVLIVSQALDANNLTQVTLWRVDLNPSAIAYTRLSDQASLISVTQSASESLTGEQQQAYVLWNTPLNSSALNVSSYQLSSQQTLTLGSNIATWDLAQSTPLSSTQGLLTTTLGSTDTLWLFDAGKAASLKSFP